MGDIKRLIQVDFMLYPDSLPTGWWNMVITSPPPCYLLTFLKNINLILKNSENSIKSGNHKSRVCDLTL